MRKLMFAAMVAAPLAVALSTPAAAQNYPFTPGDYEEVSMIEVSDGGGLAYANFLATTWKKNQEFAKSKGWITGYQVLSNINNRPGEPDLYLVVSFSSMPDAAEDERRTQAYRDFMKQSDAESEAASGDRAKYRTVLGSFLLRQLKFK
jgi:ABC-type sugar transport system substrate-binding protein